MSAKAGTAYVDVQGDFTSLNRQVQAAVTPLTGKFGKLGKAGAAGLAGVAIGGAAAGKALFDLGAKFDGAFDKIRTGTGATGDQLEHLKGSFKNVLKEVPTDFDSASTAIADLNTRLGLTGKPLEDMSAQLLELSRITETDVGQNIEAVTRTFGDWGVKVREQAPALDKMFRASQATGISVDQLGRNMVQYGAPLRQMGIGFEEAAGLLGKFEKEGVNAELVMGSLRIALGKMAREGVEDPSKALEKLTKQIQGAGSTGEANALALETFGARAGPDMAAAIREGRFDLGDLFDTIEGGSETVRGAGEDTQSFGEKWQLFKNRVLVALEPLATRVFEAMGSGMDALAAGSEWLSTDGRKHWRAFTKEIKPLVELLDGPLTEVFKTVVTTAKRQLDGLFQAFKGSFKVIMGAVKVFTRLLKGDFRGAWQGIKEIFSGIGEWFVGLLKAATAPIRSAAEAVGRALAKPISAALGAGADAVEWIVNAILDVVEEIPGVPDFDKVNIGSPPKTGGSDDRGRAPRTGGPLLPSLPGLSTPALNPKDLIGKLPNPADKMPDWLLGAGDFMIDKATAWIKDKLKGALGIGIDDEIAGKVAKALDANFASVTAVANSFGVVTGYPGSGFRPGDDGYHGIGRARDYGGPASGMLAFARVVAAGIGPQLLELIHTPLGFGIKNGAVVAPYAVDDHYDHVHIAMHNGGYIVPPGGADEMTIRGQRGEYVMTAAEQMRVRGALNGAGQPSSVRVFIGERELTDIVRVEVDEGERRSHGRYRQGLAA